MTTYSMMPGDGGYWIVAVSIGGSPIFVERSDAKDIAVRRVRALQQRAHEMETAEALPEPGGYH